MEKSDKGQISVLIVATYIAEKNALKRAYKVMSSVVAMLLVAGGANEKTRTCSRSAGRHCHAYAARMPSNPLRFSKWLKNHPITEHKLEFLQDERGIGA